MVSQDDITNVEATTGVQFPQTYCTFLEQCGPVYTPGILDLIVLRNARQIAVQQFHTIAEIVEQSQSIDKKGSIAFATDCSGNLFCFKGLTAAGPAPDDAPVWLFDHETGKTSKVALTFDAWLTQYTQLQPLLQERTSKTPTITTDLKYQIVIQFPEIFFPDIATILAFEEKLSSSLPHTQSYDGYDSGGGTTNFILYSNTPKAVLANFRKYLGTNKVEKKVRIAYRSVDSNIWTTLWPTRDICPFDYRSA